MFARQAEKHSSTREVIQISPYPWHNIQAIIRPIQHEFHFFASIIQCDREGTCCGYNKLI